MGTNKCYVDEIDYSGTWEFTDGEKNLSITVDGGTEVFKIISLSESTMVLQYSETVGGVTVDYKNTYTGK